MKGTPRIVLIVALALVGSGLALGHGVSAACLGWENGGSCAGVYYSGGADLTRYYVCAGVYDGNDCTGVQKPVLP